MEGDTRQAKNAAEQLSTTVPIKDLQRDIILEGVYHAVVEGGYHDQELTDPEVDHLCQLFFEGGIEQWEAYANK